MSDFSRTLVMVSYLDYPFYAGLSVRMSGLVAILRKEGIQVRVLAPIFRSAEPLHSEHGYQIEYIDMRWFRRLGSEKSSVKLLVDFLFSISAFARISSYVFSGASLIQYQSLYSAAPAVFAKLLTRGKIIGDDIVLHFGKHRRLLPFYYFVNYFVLRSTDVVVTASSYAFEFVKKLFPEKAVILLPNGVNLAQKSFDYKVKAYGSNGLLFVGALSFDQNLRAVEKILEIASKLDSRKIDFQIKVVGGPLTYVKHLCGHPAVKNGRVVFLGHVSPRRLEQIYHSSLIGLLPFFEDTPIVGGQRTKALEYFANKMLVLSGPNGVKGINGLVGGRDYLPARSVDNMTDMIADILAAPCSFERYAEEGFKHVNRHFSWDIIGKGYVEIVERMMPARNRQE